MRPAAKLAVIVLAGVYSSASAPPPSDASAAFVLPPARLFLRDVGSQYAGRSNSGGRAGAVRGEADGEPQFHEVPPGGPGSSDVWRGIPLDRRKLVQERAKQNRNPDQLGGGPGKKTAAEKFFSSTYRRGAGPREDDGERGSLYGARPVDRRPARDGAVENRSGLRPTLGADRPGASRVVDGLRAPARSFFDDPRSFDPQRAAPPSTGFPPGYSAPLSGFNTPLSSSRATASSPPAANPFGARESASPAARGRAATPMPPPTGARPVPVPSSLASPSPPVRESSSGSGSGSASAAGSGMIHDPLEGEKLVGSLKGGETVVHAMHGVCRFKEIQNQQVGHLKATYLVLEFADGILREQASKAPTVLTRYLGSGRGYRKRKSVAADSDDADADLEEEVDAGPALDSLSRPEVWQKRKSKARRAIRKLATDVVKLQALRGSKRRRPYPASDGGPLRLHVRAEDVAHAAPEAHGAAAATPEAHGAAAGSARKRSFSSEGLDEARILGVDLDEARTEMLAMGFDEDTVARALHMPPELKTTTARAVAADLRATGGSLSRRAAFEAGFPYTLTPDQAQAIACIDEDMCKQQTPMDRLVCGDVGFGKTEVALRAILTSALAGRQSILLAPTTVLAAQHFRKVEERFIPLGIRVALLSRYTPPKEKKAILESIATGDVDIIVGTHALLAPKIEFSDLGLVVVDEEQRFGVNQKEKLKAMAVGVDVLTLSATPIPRTLQLGKLSKVRMYHVRTAGDEHHPCTMSGLREMSTILSPPPMRRQIVTFVAPAEEDVVREALLRELARGGQCYCVVPRIADTEDVVHKFSKAALVHKIAPDARVIVANGQQEDVEDRLMRFSDGYAQVLLCTPIIEAGLDIPAVNTIIVFHANRFGLSSLYQLRGRVGRGAMQAYALFTYPKGSELTPEAQQRLDALQEFGVLGSGYALAQRDLEIRGAGSLLGADQSGEANDVGVKLYMQMLREVVEEIKSKPEAQVALEIASFGEDSASGAA